MKSPKFYLPGVNPIYRDMVLIVVVGLVASMAIVTMGYIAFSQFMGI